MVQFWFILNQGFDLFRSGLSVPSGSHLDKAIII